MHLQELKTGIHSFIQENLTVQRVLLVFTFIAVLLWLAVLTWPAKELHVYFFDVGQGDSIFLRTPGNYKILVDGGPDQTVLEKLSSVLPYYDRQIDLVILTHPHADHVNGVVELLGNYQVGKVVYNPVPYDSSEYRRFRNKVRELNISTEMLTRGKGIDLADGVRIKCFWPLEQETLGEYEDVNRASVVLRVEYGKFAVLLTGDAEFGEIYQLESEDWSPVQVLKVPHQGSRGAVTEAVLSKLRPDLAIISVGDNKFGHPSDWEIEKLESAGAKVLRTDRHGTVEVVSDGERWYYRREKW